MPYSNVNKKFTGDRFFLIISKRQESNDISWKKKKFPSFLHLFGKIIQASLTNFFFKLQLYDGENSSPKEKKMFHHNGPNLCWVGLR
jgi:hypothetical protein